jgi:predicted PhzF superfamily epimerase YddE/YHI9
MRLPITIVDAFTDSPFSGNPAAVCVLEEERDRAWMQHVAGEMNLSETAFVMRRGDAWALRWFTPSVEVDLCGHATLATAHVLWGADHAPPDLALTFRTKSGELHAKREANRIWLDFPALPTAWADAPPMLLDGLGVRPRAVGRYTFDWLVELDTEAAVRDLAPDLGLLARVPGRGVVVTAAAATPGFDFVSRFFAPQSGVPEDPVTGSAHCALAPYWGERLGKTRMLAYQASARGGVVDVEVAGERVMLGGKAVTVMTGELRA